MMSTPSCIGKSTGISCTFEWKIPTFSSYTEANSVFRSSNFHVSNATWFIKIFPNGEIGTESTEHVSLFLYKDFHSDPVVAEYSFAIMTVNHTIENKKKVINTFEGSGGWGWPLFIKRSVLQERQSELVPSDTLTIICTVELQNALPIVNSGTSKLVEDFKNLFLSKESSDVVICVKGIPYMAHQSILEARSPVLAAMFRNDMLEKRTGLVNIPDCDPEAFYDFLLFIYSGIVDFTKCNVCELYKIADKYDVSELKSLCEEFMHRNISLENFCETLIISNQFSDHRLQAEVQSFFNKNFGNIVASCKWRSLVVENFHLANSLLIAMAPNVKIV